MLSDDTFQRFLDDRSKSIEGDIIWVRSQNRPAATFRAVIKHGLPPDELSVELQGWFSPLSGSVSYTIFTNVPDVGRIYSLDVGKPHTVNGAQVAGDPHKHRWSASRNGVVAYEPQDITEPWHRPVPVWRQFCAEARLTHNGTMHPPETQMLLT